MRNENFLKDLCCALDHARRFLAGVGGYISIFFATVPPCLTQTGRIEDHHLGRFGLMLVKHDGYREKSIYVIRDDEEGRYTEKTSVYITEAKKNPYIDIFKFNHTHNYHLSLIHISEPTRPY